MVHGISKTGRDYTSMDVVVSVNEIDEIVHPDGMVETQSGESLIPLHLGTKMTEALLSQGLSEGDRVTIDLRITARQSRTGNVYPELYAKSINRINQ